MIVQGPTRLTASSSGRTQVDRDEAYARELQAQFDRETSAFHVAQWPHQRPVWPPSTYTHTLYIHGLESKRPCLPRALYVHKYSYTVFFFFFYTCLKAICFSLL